MLRNMPILLNMLNKEHSLPVVNMLRNVQKEEEQNMKKQEEQNLKEEEEEQNVNKK